MRELTVEGYIGWVKEFVCVANMPTAVLMLASWVPSGASVEPLPLSAAELADESLDFLEPTTPPTTAAIMMMIKTGTPILICETVPDN